MKKRAGNRALLRKKDWNERKNEESNRPTECLSRQIRKRNSPWESYPLIQKACSDSKKTAG